MIGGRIDGTRPAFGGSFSLSGLERAGGVAGHLFNGLGGLHGPALDHFTRLGRTICQGIAGIGCGFSGSIGSQLSFGFRLVLLGLGAGCDAEGQGRDGGKRQDGTVAIDHGCALQ